MCNETHRQTSPSKRKALSENSPSPPKNRRRSNRQTAPIGLAGLITAMQTQLSQEVTPTSVADQFAGVTTLLFPDDSHKAQATVDLLSTRLGIEVNTSVNASVPAGTAPLGYPVTPALDTTGMFAPRRRSTVPEIETIH
jgi:hypothetical protein